MVLSGNCDEAFYIVSIFVLEETLRPRNKPYHTKMFHWSVEWSGNTGDNGIPKI
jgi:hypothetical protein